MFTGLVEQLGQVAAIDTTGDGVRIKIAAPGLLDDVRHGDSIAVNGVCLTVIDFSDTEFSADVMAQTLRVSNIGQLQLDSPVNLERAAKLGSRLGGHVVQGHVDGTAQVLAVTPGKAWQVVRFSLPQQLAPLVVAKGSITVAGVSLTVSAVSDADSAEQWFEVSLIPETLAATTLGSVNVGDTVNLETDIMARHFARLAAFEGTQENGITQ